MSEFAEVSSLGFAPIAPKYDLSRAPEPSIFDALLANLEALDARTIVEIGAGTGNYTRALAARGFCLTAVELSPAMLERGREKAAASWILADALALPLRPHSVDAAVGVNVLHHLPSLGRALCELHRVVRKGLTVQAVVRENLDTLWYRHYFPEIEPVLLPLHPTLGALVMRLLSAGFTRVRSQPIFYSGRGDLTFESGRTRPEILFDESVRSSMSGFRRLSRRCIEAGLEALRIDIGSGRFEEVRAPFDAEHARWGDCIVLIARA